MSITWPTTPAPSQSSSLTVKPRWKSCQFGDGYRQVAPDGTNYINELWALQYENLDASSASTIKAAAISALTGDFITWQAPTDSVSKVWRMTETGYTEVTVSGVITSISIELERAY